MEQNGNVFEVHDPRMQQITMELGGALGQALGQQGLCFCLFIFKPFDLNGAMTYVSNAERVGMLKALVAFLEKQGAIGAQS